MPSSLGPSEGQSVVHQQEIVSFVEDGVVSSDPISPSLFAPTHLDADDSMVNSVKSFLKRPILYETTLWNTTQLPLSELSLIRFPSNWLVNPMIREKLSGFRYLKCDFKVRVQVNAMPFQAGRLLLYFEPMYGQNTLPPSSTTHFGGITGYPHVELDLMNETSMEITVPYNNLLTHYDLVRGLGAAGAVHLLIYSMLTGDAASTADVSVWMWAENVDLQLPTGMPLAPGLAKNVVPKRKRRAENAQSGTEEKRRPGNVETISRYIAVISKKLGEIPFLNVFTTPISAVADAIAGVSSIFGWSKPQDPTFPTKTELGWSKFFANFNGDAKAKVLALDARNQVEIPHYVSHTREDEMCIAYLAQKYTFLGRFKWKTADVSDTIVFNVPNVPDYCVTTENYNHTGKFNVSVGYNTMLSYLSGMFAFWRGALRYKFKVVKSPFHTGRLRVDLVPGYTGSGDYVREKVYSQIIDIRETNEFEIEVPFKWNAPWKRLAILPRVNKYELTPTALFVRVLNPLRNGGQSANQVELLVEVAAGKDFQFAYPIIKNGIRVLNQRYVGAQPDNAQSGEIISSSSASYDANSLGVGEVVTSLRQVLKRYVSIPKTCIESNGENHLIAAFGVSHQGADGIDYDSTVLTTAAVVLNPPDFYSYISYLYRFQSGSMRIASVMGEVDKSNPIRYSIYNPTILPPEVDYLNEYDFTVDRTSPQNYQYPILEPFAEIGIPFYQLWPAVLTNLGEPTTESCSGITLEDFSKSPYNHGTCLHLRYPDADFERFQLSRSIGEDFNFAFAVGPPITIQLFPK